jgi:chemotaxis protein MotB
VPEQDAAPIIVIKKKGGHGGHHGGAWKVAYADFVTAMMALFIVLWLMNTSAPVKQAVAGYFKDPTGKGKFTGTSLAGAGESLQLKADDMSKLKDTLEQAMKKMPDFDRVKDQVEMTITGEGLRIELLETEKGMFFESGKGEPSSKGRELLLKLAAELGKLNNRILLEGHTDAKQFTSVNGYSNWELSADRANSARRLMQENGIRHDQVTQVRGFADQRLRNPAKPEDDANRRISLIVQYQDAPLKSKSGSGGEHGSEKAAEHPSDKQVEHGDANSHH